MQHQLLAYIQPQVPLFYNLDIIIQKPNHAEAHRHQNARDYLSGPKAQRQLQLPAFGAEKVDWQADRASGNNANHKHEAAHGRRTVFLLVPLRPNLADCLAKIDFVQKRDHPFPQQCCNGKGNCRRNHCPNPIHFKIPLLL